VKRIDFFVHPIPALAVAGLALNDHYLKYAYPGAVTGKLSDFCGLFFFPLFLCALAVLAGARFSRGLVTGAAAVTDLAFIAVKLWPPAGAVYVGALGALGFPSVLVQDPSDLIALAVNIPLWFYATAAASRSST
jgi:hypothetical protein